MGYAVYFDNRWAGYGVPAECDMPDCHTLIDRGLGYKCEETSDSFEDPETGIETQFALGGCGLFFCSEHLYLDCLVDHVGVEPKDELPAFMLFQLTDESWAQWRVEEPRQVARYEKVLEDPVVRAEAEALVKKWSGDDDDEEVGEEDTPAGAEAAHT